MGEGIPEAKHSSQRPLCPYQVCAGPFLGGESARGHPSLVKPAVKSAPARAAQPDGARSGELPRGLVPGRGWESWLWERRLGMWLRTVGRAGESHHTNTGTAPARGSLLHQEHPRKVWPRPRTKPCLRPLQARSPGDRVISPYRLRIKTCCHLLHLLPLEAGGQAAWSQASFRSRWSKRRSDPGEAWHPSLLCPC